MTNEPVDYPVSQNKLQNKLFVGAIWTLEFVIGSIQKIGRIFKKDRDEN